MLDDSLLASFRYVAHVQFSCNIIQIHCNYNIIEISCVIQHQGGILSNIKTLSHTIYIHSMVQPHHPRDPTRLQYHYYLEPQHDLRFQLYLAEQSFLLYYPCPRVEVGSADNLMKSAICQAHYGKGSVYVLPNIAVNCDTGNPSPTLLHT